MSPASVFGPVGRVTFRDRECPGYRMRDVNGFLKVETGILLCLPHVELSPRLDNMLV